MYGGLGMWLAVCGGLCGVWKVVRSGLCMMRCV